MPRYLLITAILTLPLASVMAEDLQPTLQRYACTACHQPAVKIVGPSWQEIAAKYRDGSKSPEQLGQSIKAGSTGQWGPVPMPPQAQVSDADLKAISQWILSQQP
ncbi:Cytochrome c-552 precursor [compost metagenome]